MATNILKKNQYIGKLNVKDFIATALYKFSESLGDMVLTVCITGLALMWMGTHINPILVGMVGGYYIFAMLIVLLIRIVQRFDDSYTTEELAERILEFEAAVTGRLDEIIRNDIG